MTPERLQSLNKFLRQVVTALSTASLYTLEHRQVGRLCTGAHAHLLQALAEDAELSLMLVEERLIVDGQPLEESLSLARFAQALKARHIGHLKILPGISVREIRDLVGALSRRSGQPGPIQSTENLRFGTVSVRLSSGGGKARTGSAGVGTPRPRRLDDISDEELSSFISLFEGVRSHRKLNIVSICDLVAGFIDGFKLTGFIDTFKKEAHPLLAMAPLRALDEHTFLHSTNVCVLNLAQALTLGIDGPLLHDIGMAAMLHDIGKLFLPEELLHKQARLSEEEWELVRTHPVRGARFLLETPGIPRLAVVTAYEHHMHHDFSGYPRVPRGWRQNLCSQITTISDTYDTLRTDRSQSGALGHREISAYLRELAGSELHPDLTRNFLALLEATETAR